MHYTSNQLEHVKVGTVKPLVRREKNFCNTGELLTAELDYNQNYLAKSPIDRLSKKKKNRLRIGYLCA